MAELRTERLLLRRWRATDRKPFAALNADPEVMRHFPAPLSREQSDAMIDRIDGDLARQGYGLWAVDAPGGFIGFVGLARPRFEAHFTPALEIGWRLARHAWGHGYATEAARTVLTHAFTTLGMDALVSFTAHTNTRSRAVMERLGLTRDPAEDFLHLQMPPDHPLQPCVLYRLDATTWRAGQ
ncbi:GNAT family N-acetyltransferase [Catenuloplanes atrovinosus]|uniref:Ribosomal-protein-alanine N-acetyltransferase n=1 Tax=Catenuloplanes atrovinosus TaxID=137266 RepID=A0AAE3YLF6_9ACTN|nr:GNAT family N-acetyltransferase [Catenuloplanes atrovinosus]MDR7274456.1 ribosomal-protein-alanine N-acetyltransferase [Catenuloplanes atrovinosus]